MQSYLLSYLVRFRLLVLVFLILHFPLLVFVWVKTFSLFETSLHRVIESESVYSSEGGIKKEMIQKKLVLLRGSGDSCAVCDAA